MASHGILPLYYKNSKPTGLSGPTKSWKDNYLLVVVFVGFLILIAGTFWFLPPLEDKDADYEKTYGRFTGNPASYMTDVGIPSEPTLEPPEATENVEGGRIVPAVWKEEKEGKEEGGKVDSLKDGKEIGVAEVEQGDRLKVPVRLEDIKVGGQGEMFQKRPPESPRPPAEGGHPEPSEERDPVKVVLDITDEEADVDGVSDTEAEERRKKIIDVRSVLFRSRYLAVPLRSYVGVVLIASPADLCCHPNPLPIESSIGDQNLCAYAHNCNVEVVLTGAVSFPFDKLHVCCVPVFIHSWELPVYHPYSPFLWLL